jgi:outer membrane protein TolC
MKKHKFTLLLSLALAQSGAFAMTLEQYLADVQKHNKDFQAYSVSQEAAEDRREAGDLGLSPVLTMGGGYLSDQSQPQTIGTKIVSSQYNLGIAKEFSSGTKASLTGTVQHATVSDVPAAFQAFADYSTSSLGLSLSQSLWKNFFGYGTRLRQERQSTAAKLEKQSYDLQQRQLLIDAEMAYWDYLYQQEELKSRMESLDRAKKIEAWLKRRYSDGINDKADFLNGQALTASRQLLLDSTRDSAVAAEKNLRLFLEMDDKERTPNLDSDFKKPRDIRALVGGNSGRVLRLDAYMASLDAKTKELGAKEAKDQVRPDLVLSGAYNTNSNIQDSTSSALNKISNMSIPTTKVGLNLTYMFDTDAKVSQEALYRKEALAAQLKSERKMLESDTAWAELLRRYGEMLKQIDTAERISQLQVNKAKEQTLKLARGRAVTSDVVNSEEDAANSILTLNRLRSEARKMEAQSRLFVRMNE